MGKRLKRLIKMLGKLNKNEIEILLEFLEDYSIRLSNDGSNDYFLENTPENWAIVERATALGRSMTVEEYRESEGYEERPHDDEDIGTTDWIIVDHLVNKLNLER
jgi:hypothetical protein